MASSSNFDLTYNKLDVVAGGALSNATATTGTGSGVTKIISGGSNVSVSPSSGVGDVTISVTAGGSGTVSEVKGQGTVQGITLTGDVTTSGYLTLGGSLSAVDLTSQVTGTLPVGKGGTGALTLSGVLKGNTTSAISAASGSDLNSTFGTQTAKSFYAGPTSGADANPSFRAIAASDVPTLNQNTTGSAGSVTGLSVVGGKTLTANNTLTLSATDGSTLSIGGGGTLGSAAYTPTSQYVAASSGSAANLTLTGTLSAGGGVGTSGYFLQTTGTGVTWAAASGTSGVSSITGSNGITPSTATSGAVTLGLAAITPASVNGITLTGSSTPTLSVTGTSSISGSNTGDQTNITGNAGTATKLATGRTIAITGDLAYTSPSFDGSANVTAGGTLASIVTAAGPIGNSTTTPVVTIDAKGRVTALSSATISGTLPSGATQGQVLLEGASTAGWYNQSYNVTAFASLSAAITAAGSTGVLYFPTAYTIPSGTTISLPVIVEGLLTCSGTATFNGTIQAPLRQIFSGGTVSIGPNTPYIYPEWFGTPKTGSADDAPGIQAALLACTNSAGAYNQWVVLTASYYISSTINMVSGKMFKVVGGASFYKYGTFTGDAAVKFQYAPIGQDQGANVISDIPSLINFTGISGLTLDGNQAIEVRGFAIKNCGYAVTIKGNTAATVGVDRACNTNVVKLNFITNCYTGFYFLDDGHAATIQGNELYCNFYTNDTLTNGIAAVRINNQDCSNWDGNLVSIKSIDLGNATSSYGFLNTSSTLLPCWILECALWMGGIGSANWSTSAFVKGPYSSCTFRMRMSGALGYFPWTTVAMTGIQNRVEFINGGGNYNYTADPAYGGQPISAYKVTPTPNSRNYFNTVGGSVTNSASFNNRYTCKYEIGAYSSIPANGLLTLYVYTPITDAFQNGTSNGYPTYAASNNFSAVPFTNEGLVFESAYDNSYVNANEVVLNFRNVSGSTISGGFFNFIFTCGL